MSAINGYGSKIAVGEGSGTITYTPIASVASISGPGIKRDSIESTTMDSPEGWREFIPGLKDGGEVSFDINFDPRETTHQGANSLLAGLQDTGLHPFKLIFPTTPIYEWKFDGFLTGFDVKLPMDDKITASITIKISGKPVLAAAS